MIIKIVCTSDNCNKCDNVAACRQLHNDIDDWNNDCEDAYSDNNIDIEYIGDLVIE